MQKIKLEDFSISDENQTYLNQILKCDELSIEDKKIAFIISLLIGNFYKRNLPIVETEEIVSFCLNKQINIMPNFSELLKKINNEIEQTSEYDLNELLNPTNINDNLFIKISSVISIGNSLLKLNSNNINFNYQEYFDVLNDVLFLSLTSNNHKLLQAVFKHKNLIKNNEQFKILYDLSLEADLRSAIRYETEYLDTLIKKCPNFFTDSAINDLDNETYRKVMELIFVEKKEVAVLEIIKNDDYSTNRKKIIINYYYEMYTKKIPHEKHLLNFKFNINNVICCERLLSKSDEEYEKILKEIIKSDKPFSYIDIITNDELDEEQRKIALEIIESGETYENPFTFDFEGISHDYKKLVVESATSPILRNMPIEQYKIILDLVDSYCEKIQFYKYDYKQRKLYETYANGIVKILNCTELFGNDYLRLFTTISELDTGDASKTQDLIDFCCNKNSIYFTEEEYKRVIQFIKGSEYLIAKFFTSESVRSMESKELILKMASKGYETISKKESELTKEYLLRKKIETIFDGVSDEIKNTIIELPHKSQSKQKKIISLFGKK